MYLRKKRHRSKEDKSIIDHLHDLHMYGIPETKHIDFALPCLHIPHVSYGYRVDYTYSECFYSIFSFHNETMNIWSHLIGFICVLVTGLGMMVEYQDHHIPLMGRVATAIYCFGAGVCLFFSAVYHIFGCMSNTHQQLLLTLDMGGVAVLTGTSLFLWIAFGFQCTPVLSMVYSAFTGIIVLLGIIIAFLGSFHNDLAYYVRVLGYLAIGILCLIPATRKRIVIHIYVYIYTYIYLTMFYCILLYFTIFYYILLYFTV